MKTQFVTYKRIERDKNNIQIYLQVMDMLIFNIFVTPMGF